jgi:xylan 1,4-beta-xylosidase
LRLDADHGDVGGAYARMGSPTYPTRAQLDQLLEASALPPPEETEIVDERLSITLPAHGLATVEVPPR